MFVQSGWPPSTTWPTTPTSVPLLVNLMKILNIFSFPSAIPWSSWSAWRWTSRLCIGLSSARSAGSPPQSTCSTWQCVTHSTSSLCPSSSTTTPMRTTGPSASRSASSYAFCFMLTYTVQFRHTFRQSTSVTMPCLHYISVINYPQAPFCSCAVSVFIGSLASAFQSSPSTGSVVVEPGWCLRLCGPLFYSARLLFSISQERGHLNCIIYFFLLIPPLPTVINLCI